VGWAPFDQYPFVFFNLLLAVLVGLRGPLILMSQNRETEEERHKAEMDYTVNLKNEVNIQTVLRELGKFFQSSDPDAPGNWLLGPPEAQLSSAHSAQSGAIPSAFAPLLGSPL